MIAGDFVSKDFTVQDGTGAASNADFLPTAVLVRNGSDTAVVVTVTNKETGVYNISFTIPATYEAGDEVEVRVTAVVSSITAKDYVFSTTLDGPTIFTAVTGPISAGQYVSVSEGEAYFATKLHVQAWTDSTIDEKNRAIYEGTRLIDYLCFSGDKTDADQFLEFPRNGDTDIPEAIKTACLEIALALLDGVDPDLELENLAIQDHGIGSVRSSFSRRQAPQEHMVNGIPSAAAWKFLKPFLRDGDHLRLERVS